MKTHELATTAEIAQAYGVERQTVLQWFHAGVIPARVAVGKTFRWDAEDVAAALEEHAAKRQSERATPGSRVLVI
jgi:excisionase family DNA binding protein